MGFIEFLIITCCVIFKMKYLFRYLMHFNIFFINLLVTILFNIYKFNYNKNIINYKT